LTQSFLSDATAVAPAELIALAQKVASPRVAIAAAGAPLPMRAAMEAAQADMMVPGTSLNTRSLTPTAKPNPAWPPPRLAAKVAQTS